MKGLADGPASRELLRESLMHWRLHSDSITSMQAVDGHGYVCA